MNIWIPIGYWIKKGEHVYRDSYTQKIENVGYVPGKTCWCSHYTSEGNQYAHAHINRTYPFYHDIDNDGEEDMIDEYATDMYYDTYYSPKGYTRVSGANPFYNCHGYSTGKEIWIGEMNKIIQDDYEITNSYNGYAEIGCIGTNYDSHSHKVDSFYTYTPTPTITPTSTPELLIQQITEKNGTSGVYKKVFPYPGERVPGFTYFKRKN